MGNVKLAPLSVSDVNSNYVEWLNDKEVTRYFGESKTMLHTGDSVAEWVHNKNRDSNCRLFKILRGDNFIGTTRIDINWMWRVGTVSIMIGEKCIWGKGAFAKAGFQEEGRKRQHRFCEGKYVDEIIVGIVNEKID